jgi:transcription initiation factor TFIIIB Brf1 subunit/transcription initiation factor TFIIB
MKQTNYQAAHDMSELICDIFGMDNKETYAVKKIIDKAEKLDLIPSESIKGLIGGAIYLVLERTEHKKSYRYIADKLKITSITVKNISESLSHL